MCGPHMMNVEYLSENREGMYTSYDWKRKVHQNDANISTMWDVRSYLWNSKYSLRVVVHILHELPLQLVVTHPFSVIVIYRNIVICVF